MKRWVTASECHHTLFRPCRSLRISFGSCLAASWRERASRATRRLSPRTKSLATNPPTHQPTDRPTQTMSDSPWHAATETDPVAPAAPATQEAPVAPVAPATQEATEKEAPDPAAPATAWQHGVHSTEREAVIDGIIIYGLAALGGRRSSRRPSRTFSSPRSTRRIRCARRQTQFLASSLFALTPCLLTFKRFCLPHRPASAAAPPRQWAKAKSTMAHPTVRATVADHARL